MSLRFASLADLGKGGWKVAANSPFDPNKESRKKTKAPKLGPTPHAILWEHVRMLWGDAKLEYRNAVPGRGFIIDIAMPPLLLAIEVDGYQHHGKYVSDFTNDRERQNLLTLHGWRILRFTAGMIHKDIAGCIDCIEQTRIAIQRERHGSADR